MLKTPLERLAYIVEKAREFDAETAPVDSDSGSNPSDDKDVAILEATSDNPTGQELAAALDTLDDDQKIEILALMWLGRGDFDRTEWRQALAQARATRDLRVTDYLLGTPLLGDYLEEALAIGRELRSSARIGLALLMLGALARLQGANARARALVSESLGLLRETGNGWRIGTALFHLGSVARREGDNLGAERLVQESLATFGEASIRPYVRVAIEFCGVMAIRRGADRRRRRGRWGC